MIGAFLITYALIGLIVQTYAPPTNTPYTEVYAWFVNPLNSVSMMVVDDVPLVGYVWPIGLLVTGLALAIYGKT